MLQGEGIMVRSFDSYGPYAGVIQGRKNGVLVSMENGTTFGYSLFNLSSRGTMIVEPSQEVYIGMIIGICNKEGDLNVNPCKNKELTNTRSAHADEAIVLNKPKKFTLEEALEFIEDDEYIPITIIIASREICLIPGGSMNGTDTSAPPYVSRYEEEKVLFKQDFLDRVIEKNKKEYPGK